MDITAFVHANRDKAFLVGDYATYRRQISKQILNLRRRLGRTTPKNQKFAAKAPITAGDVAANPDFVKLQLLAAERAWAHAMAMKSAHAEEQADQSITGPARRHILSRLAKASHYANELVAILSAKADSKATDTDLLESLAYARVMLGVAEFEKQFPHRFDDATEQTQAWHSCLANYSEAHVAYSALLKATRKELFKEVIASTIDPSIRYAAYQSRISRTIPVAAVARQHFRQSDAPLLALVTSLDADALAAPKQPAAPGAAAEPLAMPTSITWRGRAAPIADAAIGQALAATSAAAAKLADTVAAALRDPRPHTPRALAAAYDPVLTCAQDAVDAVRRALADLAKEGAGESDRRTQDLRVADLAANHALIAWRIGRNRILISSPPRPGARAPFALDDGLVFAPLPPAPPRRRHARKKAADDRPAADDAEAAPAAPAESTPHQLARLQTRLALYDATLQSLDSIAALPGAARDAGLAAETAACRAYFAALRAVNIGASHALLRDERAALALYAAARDRVASLSPPPPPSSAGAAPQLGVSAAQLAALQRRSALLAERARGLVALHRYIPPLGEAAAVTGAEEGGAEGRPVVERLAEWPAGGRVDVKRLVAYPPALRAVPVKPMFLDLAFNYVEMPGREGVKGGVAGAVGAGVDGEADAGAGAGGKAQEKKKGGWFGFGR